MAGIIETGGGSAMSLELVEQRDEAVAGLRLGVHQPSPPGREAEEAEHLRQRLLAGRDRQDRGVEARLPVEQGLEAVAADGREVAPDPGVGEVELDLHPAVADHDPAMFGHLVGGRVVDQRHDHVVAPGDAGKKPQGLVVGAVEVGDEEEQPVVGHDAAAASAPG